MYPNPLERYSIGDRTEALKISDDGYLTVTIRHDEPKDKSNWLPAPKGPFYLVLRTYWPEQAALDGAWTPPSVKRIR